MNDRIFLYLFPSLERVPLYSIAVTEIHLPMLLVGAALAALVCAVNCYGTCLGAGTQLVFFGGRMPSGRRRPDRQGSARGPCPAR